MRELLSFRFFAVIALLAAMAGLLWLAGPRNNQGFDVRSSGLVERTIDVIAPVFKTTAAEGFAVRDGKTTTDMELILDATRRIAIPAGTAGQVTCQELRQLAKCAVAADLLGDGVVWFALIPAENRPTVGLPGIIDLRRDNVVLLSNGWLVRRASVVTRNCENTETRSLTDFITKFGSQATSSFNYQQQRITRVTCSGSPIPQDTVPPDSVLDSVPEGTGPEEPLDTLGPGTLPVGAEPQGTFVIDSVPEDPIGETIPPEG